MATWIKTDGRQLAVSPRRGKKFTLEEIQHFVGGYIQAVTTTTGKIMYVNEEGLLDDLPLNCGATEVIDPKWSTLGGVRGDAVVCDRGEG